MTMFLTVPRAARVLSVVAVAVLLGACASKPNGVTDGVAGGVAGASVPGSAQDFVVNVGDRVFFDDDSTELKPEGRTTLDRQAAWLARYPRVRIVVEGHADERGTREYNLALGSRRAAVTKSYLEQRGVAASRMRTISYGKERPVAVCNDISCWSQNRRAVTVVESGAAGM
jgi:peptidoglycan-associated lipoprotein